MARIRAILHVYTSERDRDGNCYHAARVTRTEDGASIFLRDIGGESNARGAAFEAGLVDGEFYCAESVIEKRRFSRMVIQVPYRPEADIARFLRGEIDV